MVDIMAQLPGLLQTFDVIERRTVANTQHLGYRRLDLLQDCWKLDSALQRWYSESSSIFGFSLEELWYSQTPSTAAPPLAVELHFADQVHAQALVLYWNVCVYVHGMMHLLHQTLKQGSENDLPERIDPQPIAIKIIQSIPYFEQPCVGLLMRQIFTFPLATAHAYLESQSTTSTTPPI